MVSLTDVIFIFVVCEAVAGCSITAPGLTWTFNSDVDEKLDNIASQDLCSQKCLDKETCKGYTWQGEGPVKFCYLFSSLSTSQDPCRTCLSGTPIRTKAGSGCSVYGDKIVETSAGNLSQCADNCIKNSDCSKYLYFNSGILNATCILYAECNSDASCQDCVSGTLTCMSPPELPVECYNYTVLDDASRGVNAGNGKYCDQVNRTNTSPDWKGEGWYRLKQPAGDTIPDRSPGYRKCGSSGVGWTVSRHPADLGKVVDISICFDDKNEDNECAESVVGKVINCGQYFVYQLANTPHCDWRYCGDSDLPSESTTPYTTSVMPTTTTSTATFSCRLNVLILFILIFVVSHN